MQILRKTEETVYPSSNAHPTLFRLSETDQARYSVPKLYFYKQGPASSQALKGSLSNLLTFYYPLAGRLVQRTQETADTCPDMTGEEDGVEELDGTCKKAVGGEEGDDCTSDIATGARAGGNRGTCQVAIGGRMDVSCLDQGALFCEAWADERLEAFGPDFQPHPHFALLAVSGHDDFLLRVQMTHFLCGGVCLCLQDHHCLCDGTASDHFLRCWVEIMSGAKTPSISPYLSDVPLEVRYGVENRHSSSVDDYSRLYNGYSFEFKEGLSNKIFHFTPQFINNIKKAARNESYTYSSFECVAAFIWRNVALARGVPPNEEVCLYYPVNGRGKLVPSLPSSYLGNVVFGTHTSAKVRDLIEKPLSYVAHLLREATSNVTNAHIRSVLDWSTRQPLPLCPHSLSSPHIFVNSWTSFSLSDLDFGWGKPLCLRILAAPLEFVIIFPSSLGRGYMDVLVALNKEHMSKLDPLMSEDHFDLF